MKYRRPARPNPAQQYKSFLIIPKAGKFVVYDIAGRTYTTVDSVREAQQAIDEHIAQVWRRKIPAKRNPEIASAGQPSKHVKNLGWLLKNWKIVKRFIVTRTDEGAIFLLAQTNDGRVFQTDFVSLYVLHGWLNRPVFKGVPVDWLANNVIVGDSEYMKLVPSIRNPLTRAESRNLQSEARIHGKIGRTPKQKAYYKGVAEGMRDAAKQYGRNPKQINLSELSNAELDRLFNYYNKRIRKHDDYAAQQAALLWMEKRERQKKINNPPVEIYDRVKEIVAVKGPGHLCDAACKRANHTYIHKFTKKHGIYGLPNKTLLIK